MSIPRLELATAAFSLILAAASVNAASDEARAAKQADLDRACEAARAEQLAPLRQARVERCVTEQEFDTQEECEAFYADFGERSGNRAGLFYDLPACVEAFEYAKSERAGD